MSDLNNILTKINSTIVAQSDSRLSFSSQYAYSVTGAMSGTTTLTGYVAIYSMTNATYLTDLVPISGGAWSTSTAIAGIKIIENCASGTLNAAGTISCTTNIVTGVGTSFTTQAVVGGLIYVNGQRGWIQSIQNNNQLTLWSNVTTSFSGVAYSILGPTIARTISNGTPPSLPVSYVVPFNDPDFQQSGRGTKSNIEDVGSYLLVCARNQNFTTGNAVVDALTLLSGYVDANLGTIGALPITANSFNLSVGDLNSVRTGVSAWVGTALCEYYKSSGYIPALSLAEKIGTYLLSVQVSRFSVNDRRSGLIVTGQDAGILSIQASTESNVNAYFFFKDLYSLTLNITHRQAYFDIQWGLLNHLYDGTLGRFLYGTSSTTGDYAESISLYAEGGIFLLDSNEVDKSVAIATRMMSKFYVTGKTIVFENNYPSKYNQTYSNTAAANGLRETALTTDGDTTSSYINPPDSISVYGTQEALLMLSRLNNPAFISQQSDLSAGQEIIYNTIGDGSIVGYTSSSRLSPYEFQVWPSLTALCWWWLRASASSLLYPTTTALPQFSSLFAFPGFTQAQVQTQGVVYLNETRLKSSQWSVTMSGNTPTVIVDPTLIKQGDLIRAVVNPYVPTINDYAFDPTISDTNPLLLNQYKQDIPYVTEVLRDSNDNLSITNYYYWAKNKTTIGLAGQLSTVDITNLMTENSDIYAIPLQLKPYNQTDGRPNRYSRLTIKSLNREVNAVNHYKLRLNKNQTMRDRDENSNLKPVFTEWKLLRRGQLDLIPLDLWNVLVDTLAASTQLNLPLPYTSLQQYDKKNKTSVSYGLNTGQVMTDADIAIATVKHTILNTQVNKYVNGSFIPDYISYTPSPVNEMYGSSGMFDIAMLDTYFSTTDNIRQLMSDLWRFAKPAQVNEIFFNVLQDMAAKSLEMDSFFKTSFVSLNEIKAVTATNQTLDVATSAATTTGATLWDFVPTPNWDNPPPPTNWIN